MTERTIRKISCIQEWRRQHPELYKAQLRRASVNRSTRMKSDPEYKERVNAQRKRHSRLHFIEVMLANARRRALKQNLEFSISKGDLVIPEVCPILGVPFIQGTKGDYKYTYSLDKVDPTKGYTKENTRVISMLANTMKSDANKDELLAFAKNIRDYIDFKI